MDYNNLTVGYILLYALIILLPFPLFSGSTHQETIHVSIFNAISARQPVLYFITDDPPGCVQESSQVLSLFINTSRSLINIKFQQQNSVSFHIPILTEQCVILNHFLFMCSVCYSEREKSSKLFPEHTQRKPLNWQAIFSSLMI